MTFVTSLSKGLKTRIDWKNPDNKYIPHYLDCTGVISVNYFFISDHSTLLPDL